MERTNEIKDDERLGQPFGFGLLGVCQGHAPAAAIAQQLFEPVSYTHLTLPTSDLV